MAVIPKSLRFSFAVAVNPASRLPSQGFLPWPLKVTSSVTGFVTPAMVRSPAIEPCLSPDLVNLVPTKLISGNSVALNQSAPWISLSRWALFVEMLDTLTLACSLLASGAPLSKVNSPENSLATPMTLEKPR